MSKWWRACVVVLLVVTGGAEITYWTLREPSSQVQPARPVQVFDSHSLHWHWAHESRECQKYDSCIHIEIDQTQLCPDQLEISVAITDINDDWVANTDMVIESPNSRKPAVIEVGANRDDFEYFMVGEVGCTKGVPNEEAEI